MALVMVTGASGFLGIHIVEHLLDRGHRVRALVRTPAKLRENLALLGIDSLHPNIEAISGDMTDAATTKEAASGCDRAIHAAATYSLRRRDAERMLRQNMAGTISVLEAAIDAGCTGIVHVSSTAALQRPGATLDDRSPLAVGIGPYSQSKVDSERVARERQDSGAPVAIVNPGGIIGPHDPYLGETNQAIRDILLGRTPVFPRGGLQYVDVRDTAEVVVAALDQPGRRYMVPGENVALPHQTLRVVTGRRLPARTVPLKALLPLLHLGYAIDRSWLPHNIEAARTQALGFRVDYTRTVGDLGVVGRSLEASMRDTVRWLADAGHIPVSAAGRCLS